MIKFHRIPITPGELSLDNVLQCGQAFRWIYHKDKSHYSTTMRFGNQYHILVMKQPDNTCVEFSVMGTANPDTAHVADHLKNYYRLEVPLDKLLRTEWAVRDSNFKMKLHRGVRLLSQDPWETLISYICSSNNNISRITKMCHSLCAQFGNKLGEHDGVEYYSFPTSDEIKERASEEKLRSLGFGYRAKFIMGTARKMVEDRRNLPDSQYLESWKDHLTYEQIRDKFMAFPGVGPKVADCVCLSGMQMDDVVPVDVHIARIAQRDYKFTLNKSKIEELQIQYSDLPVTRKKVNYELDLIRIMFKEKWGDFAGWAQGILFAQEVGKTSGATSEGMIKKRSLEVEIKVEVTDTLGQYQTVEEESIEYSVTGRPKRKSAKRDSYES